MTAEWEQKLLDVEKGTFQDAEFMREIDGMITELIGTYKIVEDAELLMPPSVEKIGICPSCGQHVVERQKDIPVKTGSVTLCSGNRIDF